MTRLRWLPLLLLASLCFGQGSYNAFQQTTFSTVTTASPIFERTGSLYHQLSWVVTGAPASCSIRVDSSPDNITYTPGGIIGATTCTSNGNGTITAAQAVYVRVNVTALSGGATVTVYYKGWAFNPTPGTGTGTITQVNTSAPVTGGPITTTGTVACPTCVTNVIGTAPIVSSGGTTPAISCPTCTTTSVAFGGVNSQTISYAAVAGDSGKIISMNGVSLTLTLPNPVPSATWAIFVENLAATNLTVSRNSLTIDGVASNLTITTNQGTFISSDGANYRTSRGNPTVAFPLVGTAGSSSAPTFSTGGASTGMYSRTSNILSFTANSNERFELFGGGTGGPVDIAQIVDDSGGICWGVTGGTPDTCFWRIGSQQIALGNFTVGDFSATLRIGALSGGDTGDISGYTNITADGILSGAKYATNTNCKATGTGANPSVASCAAAASGVFSCATNASAGTCQVNTTVVTANSQIIVVESADPADATRIGGGITCNVLPTVFPGILLKSRVAGTSFTINAPTFTVNPTCFEYHIVN